MSYGKDAYHYLQDAVELNPHSLEAARALGDAVAGMVEADSQGIIQSALDIKLKPEASRALEILEKNGLKTSENFKTITKWLPKLKDKK